MCDMTFLAEPARECRPKKRKGVHTCGCYESHRDMITTPLTAEVDLQDGHDPVQSCLTVALLSPKGASRDCPTF